MASLNERLSATVERVTFHSPETGFAVLRARAKGASRIMTIVGKVVAVSPGEEIEAVGKWVMDRTHGRQFAADEIRIDSPRGRQGIERYLASGAVRGVGPGLAKQMVQRFGTRVFEIIEHEPGKLAEISGIGPKRAQMISRGWQSQKVVREIMVFLMGHGIGAGRAMRIWKTWGERAVAILKENPYRLADEVRGIGFSSADKIAADLGIEKTSPYRLRAGVVYALGLARVEGHCGIPEEDLRARAGALLQVEDVLVAQAIEHEALERRLIRDEIGDRSACFLPQLWYAEARIALRLHALCDGQPPWRMIDPDLALASIDSSSGASLSPSQRVAIEQILQNKVTVITGGPGVGKTTLVNAVISVLAGDDLQVMLAAPTGRAARRLTESTGVAAKTIHRLLEVDPQSGSFRKGREDPLECDLLVVDEASMIDVPLMAALLDALPPSAALLIVGDVDQLPSVGPGQVLRDIIASDAVPVVRLTEVFRQAARSRIVLESHRVNRGELPSLEGGEDSDFFFVNAKDGDTAARLIVKLVTERVPRRFGLDPLREIQVLAPMNRGAAGVAALNGLLQDVLHPHPAAQLERFGVRWLENDKVMQLENDYDREVFNGDVGVITKIDEDEGVVHVDFEGRAAEYGVDELDRLAHAYATTIHKSQGSEYPAVIIPILSQHHIMLQRNLLYTAITRGRKLVVIVGELSAIRTAVRNASVRARWTRLRQLLADRSAAPGDGEEEIGAWE